MDQAVEERAAGKDGRPSGQPLFVIKHHSGKLIALYHNTGYLAPNQRQVALVFDDGLHSPGVGPLVDLGPGTPDRPPLTLIQGLILQAGLICRQTHFPAQGVDLPHQVAFGQAANGRIARHAANGFRLQGNQ